MVGKLLVAGAKLAYKLAKSDVGKVAAVGGAAAFGIKKLSESQRRQYNSAKRVLRSASATAEQKDDAREYIAQVKEMFAGIEKSGTKVPHWVKDSQKE